MQTIMNNLRHATSIRFFLVYLDKNYPTFTYITDGQIFYEINPCIYFKWSQNTTKMRNNAYKITVVKYLKNSSAMMLP